MVESVLHPPSRSIAMPMLPSRHYVSDHTQFIRELIDAKPDLPKETGIGAKKPEVKVEA